MSVIEFLRFYSVLPIRFSSTSSFLCHSFGVNPFYFSLNLPFTWNAMHHRTSQPIPGRAVPCRAVPYQMKCWNKVDSFRLLFKPIECVYLYACMYVLKFPFKTFQNERNFSKSNVIEYEALDEIIFVVLYQCNIICYHQRYSKRYKNKSNGKNHGRDIMWCNCNALATRCCTETIWNVKLNLL